MVKEKVNFELYDIENEKKLLLKEYRKLLRLLKDKMSATGKKNLKAAFDLAAKSHNKTRRKSGELYIFHPVAVSQIVVEEMGLGLTSAICGLLHDTVEDTELTIEDIALNFNSEIAEIVEGLTKISGIIDGNTSLQIENYKKLIITISKDYRVILIKIADRLHNMRTLDSMEKYKQQKIASETLFLYAPLAHRIGLYNVKSELEDLSLKFLEPKEYRNIALKLKETKRQRTRQLNEFIKPIKEELEKQKFKFEIKGRPKSIYSIWNKIHKKGVPFEEVFDLLAIRIILNVPLHKEKQECWNVYSLITDKYVPNKDRFRDWISKPKPNGYESLHTTVMGPQGKFIEVQIRSKRMDDIAEKGYAAHIHYKEGKLAKVDESPLDSWFAKISDRLKNSDESSIDIVDDFKMDLYNDEIYVFTPKGELVMMPNGSTILDFAFEIHTAIGSKCIGAKVSHKLVSISHKLESGTQIEIITGPKQKPSEDWLKIATTSKAKSAIKSALKSELRKDAQEGKQILIRKLKSLNVELDEQNLQTLLGFYNEKNHLIFLQKIYQDSIDLSKIKHIKIKDSHFQLPKPKAIKKKALSDEEIINTVKDKLKDNAELMIMGEDSSKIEYSYATCCNPIPGDDVFGFITVSDGVKIHRMNCPNAVNMMSKYNYRIIKTKWSNSKEISFLTGFKVSGIDGLGIINKMTQIISENYNVNIRSLSIESEEGIFEGIVYLYVTDIDQLYVLMEKIKKLEGVIDVVREESEE